jgi:hypothetical protein
MQIKDVHKFEKAVIFALNIDGWDLKWTGDSMLSWDAQGLTPKGHKCVIEMKFRDRYYETKMLEKYKYNKLMKLDDDIVKLYFVNDPKGNYLFWLNDLEDLEVEEKYCPSTTMWDNKKRTKKVYLLREDQASIVNLNI